MNNLYLLDREFLKELDNYQHREIFARIIKLNYNEEQIEEVQGRIVTGSINIDGTSAVRRTCSLTITSDKINTSKYQWTLNTKFKLEIGLKNFINSNYPNIVWFPQGIYLISSFNESVNPNSHTISISGKDKMCMLNGEVGGTVTALSWDFGTIDEADEYGNMINSKRKIKDIIHDAVREYSREPLGNIIIDDLDDDGLELLEYRGDMPLYIFIKKNDKESSTQVTFDSEQTVYLDKSATIKSTVSEVKPYYSLFEMATIDLPSDLKPDTIYLAKNGEPYYVLKLEYGITAGYRATDLIYAGDLILRAGETITSLLDKIVAMLGEYEYFFDVDGRFHFQRKKIYVNHSFIPEVDNSNEKYIENATTLSPYSYSFLGNKLITVFQNTPNLTELKNDYSLWGNRTTVTGSQIPVHIRYAIDTKPTYYKNIAGQIYTTQNDVKNSQVVDWREIIYQMALDYNQYFYEPDVDMIDFLSQIENNNEDSNGVSLYPNGRTGYEQYYVDIQGFWRQIYCPTYDYRNVTIGKSDYDKNLYYMRYYDTDSHQYIYYHKNTKNTKCVAVLGDDGYTIFVNDSKVNPSKNIGSIYKDENEYFLAVTSKFVKIEMEYNTKTNYYLPGVKNGWLVDILQTPELLNFWFDFLDDDAEMGQFNVRTIGIRPKVVNDNEIKSIYFRETPNILFYDPTDPRLRNLNGYTRIQCPSSMNNLFQISSQGKSARYQLDGLLYKHGYCIETVSLTSLPIYYLQPNTRIFIDDKNTGINGDYLVSRLSYNFNYNATMSITATKAVNKIY